MKQAGDGSLGLRFHDLRHSFASASTSMTLVPAGGEIVSLEPMRRAAASGVELRG